MLLDILDLWIISKTGLEIVLTRNITKYMSISKKPYEKLLKKNTGWSTCRPLYKTMAMKTLKIVLKT